MWGAAAGVFGEGVVGGTKENKDQGVGKGVSMEA